LREKGMGGPYLNSLMNGSAAEMHKQETREELGRTGEARGRSEKERVNTTRKKKR
jgi:hypothetical protein